MDFSHYIDLLSSLSSEAFTLWSLLATVSLGVIAFIGSLKRLTIPYGLAICLVFSFFAVSNYFALQKNFTSRQVVSDAAHENFEEDFASNEALVRRLDLTYEKDVKRDNLALHAALDVIVVLIVLGFTLSRGRKYQSEPHSSDAND